jgi:hypothetical protein
MMPVTIAAVATTRVGRRRNAKPMTTIAIPTSLNISGMCTLLVAQTSVCGQRKEVTD